MVNQTMTLHTHPAPSSSRHISQTVICTQRIETKGWNPKGIISGPDMPYRVLLGAVRPSWLSVQRGILV